MKRIFLFITLLFALSAQAQLVALIQNSVGVTEPTDYYLPYISNYAVDAESYLPTYNSGDSTHRLITTASNMADFNNASYQHFFVQPGDYYSVHGEITLSLDGTSGARRTIQLYNGNNTHPAQIAVSSANLARVMFNITSDFWVIDRMAHWDQFTTATQIIDIDGGSDNIINRFYNHDVQGAMVTIYPNSHRNQVQNCFAERTQLKFGGTNYIRDRAVFQLMDKTTGTPQIAADNVFCQNETYNMNDGFQAIRQFTTQGGLGDVLSYEGTIVDCNAFWIDGTIYCDNDGTHNPNGIYADAENAIDIKCGSANPAKPMIITNNYGAGFRPPNPQNGELGDNGTSIVLHFNVKNIEVDNNFTSDSNQGMNICCQSFSQPSIDAATISNNIFTQIADYSLETYDTANTVYDDNLFYDTGGGSFNQVFKFRNAEGGLANVSWLRNRTFITTGDNIGQSGDLGAVSPRTDNEYWQATGLTDDLPDASNITHGSDPMVGYKDLNVIVNRFSATPTTLLFTGVVDLARGFVPYGVSIPCSNTTVGNTTAPLASNSFITDLRASQFTMPEDGILTDVSIYHVGTGNTGNLLVGVYNDNGSNAPGNLVATSALVSDTNTGWNDIALVNSIEVTAGTKLWLAVVGENLQITFNSGTGLRARYATDGFHDALPASFGTSASVAAFDYAIKANYICNESLIPDYYVSSNGTGTGTSSSDPMSIASAQSLIPSLTSGEIIGFKGGDSFPALTISSLNGSSGNPITFTSYGTGQAKITGAEAVTGWTDAGGNIWTKTMSNVEQVFKNDTLVQNARIPSIAATNRPDLSYYTVSNGTGSRTTFTASSLIGEDLLGAVAHVSGEKWRLDGRTISSFNTSTGAVTLSSATSYDIDTSDRFFISNHESLLANQNDWAYRNGTLYMYSIGEPTSITATTSSSNLVDLNSCSYLNFENLTIKGTGANGFDLDASTNITVDNCNLHDNYYRAVNLTNTSTNFTLKNSDVRGSNNYAIADIGGGSGSNSDYVTIDNCTFSDIGRFSTIAKLDTSQSAVLETWGDNLTFTNNIASDLGYLGVMVRGANSLIKYNKISDFALTLDDGAAFYTHTGTNPTQPELSGTVFEYNIAIGQNFGTQWYANGFYSDDRSTGTIWRYNTAIGTYYGGYLHNSEDVDFLYNNFYATKNYAMYVQDDAIDSTDPVTMQNNQVQYNNFFATSEAANQDAALTVRTNTEYYAFGTIDNNYYFAPYDSHQIKFGTASIHGAGGTWDLNRYDLDVWNQTGGYGFAQGWDANSVKDNLTWTSGDHLTKSQIIYNDQSTAQSIDPGTGSWYEMDGTEHTGLVTLQPFESMILINETPAPPPSGKDPADAFPDNNVASPFAETNSVALWDAAGQSCTYVSDADADDGLYALKITSTTDNYSYRSYQPNLTAGDQYQLIVRAKKGATGATQNIRIASNATAISGSIDQNITTTSYATYTFNFQVTANGIVDIRFMAIRTTGGAVGYDLFVDNITMIKTN